MKKPKIDLEKLKAAHFPVCDAIAMNIKLEVCGTADPKAIQTLENQRGNILKHVNNYLKIFAAPIEHRDPKDNKFLWLDCLNCGQALTGLFGSFEYTIRHGEGACSVCGYPGRADHYIEHEGFKLAIRKRVLQYHPSELKRIIRHGNNGD